MMAGLQLEEGGAMRDRQLRTQARKEGDRCPAGRRRSSRSWPSSSPCVAFQPHLHPGRGQPAGRLSGDLFLRFFNPFGLPLTINRFIFLLLCTYAFIIPYRAGLWNIGMTGQLYTGALAAFATVVCFSAARTQLGWTLPPL